MKERADNGVAEAKGIPSLKAGGSWRKSRSGRPIEPGIPRENGRPWAAWRGSGAGAQRELRSDAEECVDELALRDSIALVAIPVTNDQPAVAARIAPAQLQRAVRQVLGDDRYRDRARRLQATIQAVGRSLSIAAQPPGNP